MWNESTDIQNESTDIQNSSILLTYARYIDHDESYMKEHTLTFRRRTSP